MNDMTNNRRNTNDRDPNRRSPDQRRVKTPPSEPKTHDPTRVTDQPALRTSNGTAWVVMGGLLVIASYIPLLALIFVRRGPSQPIAIATAVIVLTLYGGLLISRLIAPPGRMRLRVMAACMLTSAFAALIGMVLCVLAEVNVTQ